MSGLNILLKYIHKDSFSRKNVKATKNLKPKGTKAKNQLVCSKQYFYFVEHLLVFLFLCHTRISEKKGNITKKGKLNVCVTYMLYTYLHIYVNV